MAVIPRFVSTSAITPAFNQVKTDGESAAAPYKAAAQSTAQIFNALQGELSAWGGLLEQKQKEQQAAEAKNAAIADGLYKAEAQAQMKIQGQQLFQKHQDKLDGRTNIANYVDQDFKTMVDGLIASAPSDNARLSLLKSAMGIRAGLYNQASNFSIKQNNQINMNNIESMLEQREALANLDPNAIGEIRQNSKEIFSAMASLGVPPAQRQVIERKFNNNLDNAMLRGIISSDPKEGMKHLESGAYAHLGAKTLRALTTFAQTRTNAMSQNANKSIDEQIERLLAGMPLTEKAPQAVSEALKFNLKDKVETFDRLAQLSKDVGSIPAEEMENLANTLKIQAAQGKLEGSPKDIELLTKFLKGNAEALKKDPVLYAQVRGNVEELQPINNFAELNPQEIERRRLRALQIRDLYQVEAPMLSSIEADIASKMLTNSDPDIKTKIISNFKEFDRNTRMQVAEKVGKADKATAAALITGAIDPEVVKQIADGSAKRKLGSTSKFTVDTGADSTLNQIFADKPALRTYVLEAAKSLAALEDSGGVVSEDHIKKAANIVDVSAAGGWFFGKEYSTVAPAPGMSGEQFSSFVDTHLGSADNWAKFGTGTPANAADGSLVDLKTTKPADFQYRYESDGMYSVFYKDKQVADQFGKKVRVDLQQIYREKAR